MRNLKLVKIVSLILALVFVIGMFAACEPTDDPNEPESDPPSGEAISVNGEGLSQYKVIYKSRAEQSVKNAADLLCDQLKELFDYSIPATMDSTPKTDFEIVIGESNRTNDDMTKSLRATDYKVFVEGKTIFILAGSEDTLEAAVNAFIGALSEIYVDNKANITAENMNIVYSDPGYSVSNITLNGVNITDYTIVYAADDTLAQTLANNIKDTIAAVSGYNINAVADSIAYAGGKEILVGNSNRLAADAPGAQLGKKIKSLKNNNLLMYTEGEFFFLGGKSGNNIALIAAANKLIKAINNFEGSDTHAISFNYSDETAPTQTKYRIMTYNDGDLSYSGVKLMYRCNLIKEYAPDIIGFQEFQAADQKRYEAQLTDYKFIYYHHEILSADHQPTNMYGAPIAYLESKFDLVESGTQWLSDTPDEPNSKFPYTAYIRSYVYAILKDKTTGEEFVVINTHVDYNSTANVQQIKVLLECTEKFKGKPLVYTGDFNMRFTSEGYKMMEAAGFKDAERYKSISATGSIDFIFFDPTKTEVTYFKCINDHTASAGMIQAGSDHNPYIADIVIPG